MWNMFKTLLLGVTFFDLHSTFPDSYIIKLIHVVLKSSIRKKNIEMITFLKSYIFCKLLMIFFKDINDN